MQQQFNHHLLLLARRYRELSQSQVADSAGLDQGHYSRIERGLLNAPPSEAVVSSISAALDFPESFFLQHDESVGLPLSFHEAAWRKRSSVRTMEMRRLHAELNLRIMHVRRYLEAVDLDIELPLPRLDADDAGGADEVARIIRKSWMVPEGPISNLTALCERAGVLVIPCDFAEKIDGVTMRLRDLPPLIFLNQNAPADRMRHSLAHELGHLIMHSIPTDEMESEADLFASELLAPERQLRRDLIGGRITLERLVQLKKYWRVSVASLLYRAGRNGYLTDNQSSYLWRQLSARGWRKKEPDETQFARETARLYFQILSLHETELGYGLDEIAQMLHMSGNEVRKLYGIGAASDDTRRFLRVVK